MMEINILAEIFDIITQIHLPTVIKVEVKREEILKALKNIDAKAKNVEVSLTSVSWHRKRAKFQKKDLNVH